MQYNGLSLGKGAARNEVDGMNGTVTLDPPLK